MQPIRVFIIDDSALVRAVLGQIVSATADMVVVGEAGDPLQARERMRDLEIDVVTLDVEMPRMDGIDFLERLMRLRPTPVIMVSTLTERGADVTLRALELGAVDYVAKPKLGVQGGLQEIAGEIVDKIRIAARARVRKLREGATPVGPTTTGRPSAATTVHWTRKIHPDTLIAIGASTGGTEALRVILEALPGDMPPILVAQHMPAGFTQSFAQRLDAGCALRVCEARHGMRVARGHVYIAPGGRHLSVDRGVGSCSIVVNEDPPVNRHRPSVDYLFESVAQCVGQHAIGVMLTGMGRDGAVGMLRMREAGSHNVAQDADSCVVFGMPREAINAGAIHEVAPLEDIAGRLLAHLGARFDSQARVLAHAGVPG